MQRYVIHRFINNKQQAKAKISARQKLKFLHHILKLASNWTIRFSTKQFWL